MGAPRAPEAGASRASGLARGRRAGFRWVGPLSRSLFAVTVLGAGLSHPGTVQGPSIKVRTWMNEGQGCLPNRTYPVCKWTSQGLKGDSSRKRKPLLRVKLRSDSDSRR